MAERLLGRFLRWFLHIDFYRQRRVLVHVSGLWVGVLRQRDVQHVYDVSDWLRRIRWFVRSDDAYGSSVSA